MVQNTLQAARNVVEPRTAVTARAAVGVASKAMPRVEFYTAVDTGDWVTAAVTIVVAFLIAEIVDRALKRRGKRLSSAVAVGELSPVATRARWSVA